MNTPSAPARLKIDVVSDVVCPWCAIGLSSLEIALGRLEGEVEARLEFQPFELNPQMGADGEEVVPYLARKYGLTHAQVAANQESIRARGAAVGFEFRMDRRTHTYNTFDAHRLLMWAAEEGDLGRQVALKRALLRAHFTDGENPSSRSVLVRCVEAAGLDAVRAARVIDSDAYAAEVRQRERYYLEAGVNGVPAVIVNDRHLIQGGQPPEVFEQALRRIAQEG